MQDSISTKKKSNNEKRFEETQQEEVSNHMQHSDLTGDYKNVFVLFLLYVLQGIPLGLGGSIPMILQSKNVSYKYQAMFSLVYWPYSLKLLWAPIVDALFFQQMGRRKSWLIPVQYLIGLFMLILSMNVDEILESEFPNVTFLTIMFFSLNFLAATQDIAVDGWALTMLQKRNVSYGSTCNSVGQTAGYFLAYVILLAFSSADFCNKYIRTSPQDNGIITLGGFLFFWGISFLIITSMVWVFVIEKDEKTNQRESITDTYLKLFQIIKLPAVKQIVLILLTVKVGFAAADSVTGLKLIEAGLKKETLSILAVPLVPLEILLPLAISRFTSGPRPLDLFIKAMPYRLVIGLLFAVLVYWTGTFPNSNTEGFPYYYYAIILFIYALHQVAVYSMYVASMAFFARVSDPTIGGTYMTLLNTMSNFGGSWPDTLVLWLVDPLTSKRCITASGMSTSDCSNAEFIKSCMDNDGKCVTHIDGFYVESAVCFIIGFLWLKWKRISLMKLQNLKEKDWKLE